MSRPPILLVSTLLFAGALQAAESTPPTNGRVSTPSVKPASSRVASAAARLRGPVAEIETYDKPAEAERFYWRKRSPDGVTPVAPERYLDAAKAMAAMPQRSSVGRLMLPSRADGGGTGAVSLLEAGSVTSTWEPLGPGNIGGRTRALVIDRRHPKVMFAAGVAGGVWKSNDAGKSWRPIADFLPNIAVNSLVMAPGNSNVLYAGTGEGYFNGDAARGAGIFKTTDAGATWTRLPATATSDFYYVNDLVVSSTTPNRVYAATGTGVWRSTDGGQTWAHVLKRTAGTFGGCLDLAMRTDQKSDFVFASCNTFSQAEVWRNTRAETGTAWGRVLSQREMGRTTLAIAPSNQDIVYALGSSIKSTSPYSLGFHALFRSDAAGANTTWKAQLRNSDKDKLNTLLLSNPIIANLSECEFGGSDLFFNQGWYDNVIAVDPVDPEIVWAGGVDLFRSEDGGRSFGVASYWWATDENGVHLPSYAHADQHTIVFSPTYDGVHDKTMFIGNDGGIFRTDDARGGTARGLGVCDPEASAMVFTDLNHGYAVTQFYHGLPYPDGTQYFGGTQDNGTPRGSDGAGPNAWTEINFGDGGYVAIDPANTNILYSENTGNSMQKSINGGATWLDATAGISDPGFLFIAPFTMDPLDAERLFTGGAYIWRTADGATNWERASGFVAGGNNSLVSAVAAAPTRAGRALVGLTEGFIHYNDDARGSDPTVSWPVTQPRFGYVSSVGFDPHDADVAYATYSTFGGTHVWKSRDGGRTWSALDGNGAGALPDVPVHALAVDPADSQRLFIGTDLGVFVTVDGGAHWDVEDTGFPNVVTEWIVARPAEDGTEIYAFTHGRGTWRAKVQE